MTLDILYEDNHIIAVNKPAGVLMQGDVTGDKPLPDSVKDYIKVKYNKPGDVYLGVVHRIDRPVSGVVIFARTSKAGARLSDAFRNQKIEKTYLAIVEGKPPEPIGNLRHHLSKNAKLNKSYIDKSNKGKLSELSYHWIGSSNGLHLLEVQPGTGRHHQIRVMLANIGCVIKGDLKYGSKRRNSDGNIALHASALKFIHPVKKEEMLLYAPLPNIPEWKKFSDLL